MHLIQGGGKGVAETEDDDERNRNSPRYHGGQSPCATNHRTQDERSSCKPVRSSQIAQRLNSTTHVFLSKLSVAKLVRMGLIPLQILRYFLRQLGAVGQASSKCKLSAGADRLDSCPPLLFVFDPVSFQPCVGGFMHDY